jgi:hypothetical protein
MTLLRRLLHTTARRSSPTPLPSWTRPHPKPDSTANMFTYIGEMYIGLYVVLPVLTLTGGAVAALADPIKKKLYDQGARDDDDTSA